MCSKIDLNVSVSHVHYFDVFILETHPLEDLATVGSGSVIKKIRKEREKKRKKKASHRKPSDRSLGSPPPLSGYPPEIIMFFV